MQMTPEKLKKIIQDDLAVSGRDLCWYGRSLAECFVEPNIKEFNDACNNNELISLWLVFEERSGNESGYKIVYCEENEAFGLVVFNGEKAGTLIGIYGSFVETLRAM